jgi:prepilin-type N-terminal cleavage/methylation domain-containing protein
MTSRRGFTMIEMLGVIVIVAILAALAYPQFSTAKNVAGSAGARQDLLRLQQAVTDAYQETGAYPASTGAWVTTVGAPTNFTSTTGYQLQITTDVGSQGAVLQSRTSNGNSTCSVNVGNKTNPGLVTGC